MSSNASVSSKRRKPEITWESVLSALKQQAILDQNPPSFRNKNGYS